MRYWVYINGKVIEMPFEEGELSAIKGFNADTLVCKETPAPGESQEWVPAKMLIESYRQPAPPPPPSRQVIEKFAAQEEPQKQDTFIKEPKATILSGNIFGSEEKKDNIPDHNEDIFAQTEALSPEEIAQENQDINKTEEFAEPLAEEVSFDEVEGIDLDKHADNLIEREEEILKTAIKTTISRKKVKKEDQTIQAIDILNNNNIDLSDIGEEMPKKDGEEKTFEEEFTEDGNKVKNLSQTELTPLGNSDKKPLTRLFDNDSNNKSEPVKEQEKPTVEDISATPTNVEDEFNPEEEISLGDEDFIIDANKDVNPVVQNNAPAPKEVQEVLQEFANDKDLENQKEKTFEETLKTSSAFIDELQAENPVKEVLPKEENSILDLQPQTNKEEDRPTSLDELTGRAPIVEESSVKQEEQAIPQENQGNKPEGVFIPSEIHPDVIVEEVKEEVKEEPKKEQKPLNQEEQNISDKDNFLNTFSSDIETVFLDQPTAFISDYIPPAETKEEDNLEIVQPEQKDDVKPEILDIKSDQGQHQVSLQNVRRVKPAAIKTVPMVEGERTDPFSQTQIQNLHAAEEAMAKVEHNNNIINSVKTFGLIVVFLLLIMAFVAFIAQFNVIPKDFSPLHAVCAKLFKKDQKVKTKEKVLTTEEIVANDLKAAEELRINKLIQEVKDYKLPEGITLDEKIKKMHPNVYNQLKWEAKQEANDLTYYSVTVSSPTNPEGYAQVNYRFSYNTVSYGVEATTSEANNLMIIPYQEPVQNNQQTQQ